MRTSSQSSDEGFTLWGGALLLVAGVLLMFDRHNVSFMVTESQIYSFTYASARIATDVVLAAGFIVTAFGRRQGQHLTGDVRLGPILLSLFGVAHAALAIISQLAVHVRSIEYLLLTVVQILAAAAGLSAAAAVYRSKIANKSTRILLILVAVVFAVFTVFALIPSTVTLAVAGPGYVFFPLSLIAFGGSLMLERHHDPQRLRHSRNRA